MFGVRPEAKERTWSIPDGMTVAGEEWSKPTMGGGGGGGGVAGGMMMGGGGAPQVKGKVRRVLMLHGWLDNVRVFHLLAPYLVNGLPDGSDVIAMDLVGHGNSSHRSRTAAPAMHDDHVYYIQQVIQQLGWGDKRKTPITLIGHSFGGALACIYASVFPEQVEKLVLLECVGPEYRDGDTVPKQLREKMNFRNLTMDNPVVFRIGTTLDDAARARKAEADKQPNGQHMSEECALELAERGSCLDKELGEYKWKHDYREMWVPLRYFGKEQAFGILKAIKSPTLILNAENGFHRDKLGDEEVAVMKCKKTVKIFQGSHHFFADPDDAPPVLHDVLQFILK